MLNEHLKQVEIRPGKVIYKGETFTDIRKLATVIRKQLAVETEHSDICLKIYFHINRYYMSLANNYALKIKKS